MRDRYYTDLTCTVCGNRVAGGISPRKYDKKKPVKRYCGRCKKKTPFIADRRIHGMSGDDTGAPMWFLLVLLGEAVVVLGVLIAALLGLLPSQ